MHGNRDSSFGGRKKSPFVHFFQVRLKDPEMPAPRQYAETRKKLSKLGLIFSNTL